MDYKKLNFKCGLEIHQQLFGKKLFCSCPVITNKTEEPDFIVKRRLRASMGEMGKIDEAAKFEQSKNKEFIYESYNDCDCLVDLDCEPIHGINEDALNAAFEVSLLLNAQVVDEIHVMRKVVVDGSNVSGFQRTMLIAIDGFIETTQGKVGIATICLEEEAAKKINENEDSVTYRLDRLGVPLIEIATTPDIRDEGHAKEVASTIGMILRSTGKVLRGIGTIREDINLSIKNFPRIELKGFQDLRSIPVVIEKEIERQLKEKPLKGEVRKVNVDNTTSFLRPMPGASRMYPETDHPSILISKDKLKKIVLSELISEKILKLEKKFNLRKTVAQEVLENNLDLDSLSKKYKNLEPKVIADVILEIPKEIKTRFNIDPKSESLEKVLENLNNGKISKNAIVDILVAHSKGETIDFSSFKKISDKEIEIEIKKIISYNKELNPNAIMGILMKKYRGKVDGKKIFEIISKYKK